MNNFFACCGRLDKKKDSENSIASFATPDYPQPVLSRDAHPNIDQNSTSQRICGLGIAFKPNARGAFVVKRIICGGPAESSGAIQVDFANNPQSLCVPRHASKTRIVS